MTMTDCRELGREATWLSNKHRETGVIGSTDLRCAESIYFDLHDAAVEHGRDAFAKFADGFEEVVDRSLNSDWRL